MKCLCAIYVDRNQCAFLAQMTSFVMRYDVIYHFFLINSQCLMTWGVDSPEIINNTLRYRTSTGLHQWYVDLQKTTTQMHR